MLQTDLEKHVFAYFLAHGATTFSLSPKAAPRTELHWTIKDKVEVDAYSFGRKVRASAEAVAREFLDLMLEAGAFSTVEGHLNATAHIFQPDAYRARLESLQQENPILAEAKGAGPEFWEERFKTLLG